MKLKIFSLVITTLLLATACITATDLVQSTSFSSTEVSDNQSPSVENKFKYLIADTGQGKCMNNDAEINCPDEGGIHGQDALHAGNLPRYQENGDGIIGDLVSGSMRQQDHSSMVLYTEESIAWVAQQNINNFLGYNDWPHNDGLQNDVVSIYHNERLVSDTEQATVPKYSTYLPLVVRNSGSAGGYNIWLTLSDGAQRNTIAFDGLAFLTGNLGADSFFPPGKVADFWGFQYLRDNDPTQMGHNTDFLTRAALNMLHVLTPAQRTELITLAEDQVDDINQYAYDRFLLMDAFRRLLERDLPPGSTGLDAAAVQAYSATLCQLDGVISYDRAQLMGGLLNELDPTQRAYLDAMVGQGMLNWPVVEEPPELPGLPHDVKVAVMTYAGDMFSWYVGSIEADVYFCPERQGTYFGSFYMKDALAVGNPGYSIPVTLTAEIGADFLNVLTPDQAAVITGLVDIQKPSLYEIVDRREDVSMQLRQFMSGSTPDKATILALMNRYGELDGEIIYLYATAFSQVSQTLTVDQRAQLMTIRTDLLGDLAFPTGAYLYSEPIAFPEIPDSDFLFAKP